ncbi:hypothetical protein BHM03_00003104 [Ensete ventricosum]|nr:hypothetical protein BHM03_00003104 [Ensete ventricosum]
MIAWFRGEFAAANAIIDALCGHLVQIGEGKEYEAVFAAIHRRRLNWIPVLHMQKYYSIADVTAELRLVAANAAAISFASAAEEPLEATPEEVKTMESGDAQADEDHAASEDTAADGATIAVDDEAAAAAAAEEPATGAAAEGGLTEGGRVGLEEEAAPPEVCSGDSSGHKSAEDCDVKGVTHPFYLFGLLGISSCIGRPRCSNLYLPPFRAAALAVGGVVVVLA